MERKPNRELDRFSSFMFGQRDAYNKDDNQSMEFPEQKEHSSFKSSSGDDWFLGSRRNEPDHHRSKTQSQLEDHMNNIDFVLLMETIDMFVATANQYKPLFNEVTPIFQKFIKKFKSSK
ncbi:hypothetical protein QE429_001011 [Bacillus sp. SORGH_AS 510]|uniref:hypothetical protein n=1 Tax=Bacillus sp. SORGH_AS_0510 TaxID=3041771 RepID=UPI00277DBD01|nr:hypothetical protein [Bacillus sp. SORGH_AS_0510]MDQ1144184.1 hypothetical protein [Bacillus sp. SORGH_AS_0510]